jgi:hypothetical protein
VEDIEEVAVHRDAKGAGTGADAGGHRNCIEAILLEGSRRDGA